VEEGKVYSLEQEKTVLKREKKSIKSNEKPLFFLIFICRKDKRSAGKHREAIDKRTVLKPEF